MSDACYIVTKAPKSMQFSYGCLKTLRKWKNHYVTSRKNSLCCDPKDKEHF